MILVGDVLIAQREIKDAYGRVAIGKNKKYIVEKFNNINMPYISTDFDSAHGAYLESEHFDSSNGLYLFRNISEERRTKIKSLGL